MTVTLFALPFTNIKPIMKNKILSLCTLALFFVSCSNSNSDDTGSQQEIVSNGTWRVTLFTDSGNNETSDFNGYAFTFGPSGAITATKGSQTQNGTWSISSNDFNINLGPKVDSNKPLGELTDDWDIISISNTEIKLKDDNAASNEFLTFTKN